MYLTLKDKIYLVDLKFLNKQGLSCAKLKLVEIVPSIMSEVLSVFSTHIFCFNQPTHPDARIPNWEINN